MTMQQLLWQGVQELNKAGVPDPQLDARYLLLEVFHLNLASFLALKARELGKDEETEGKCREFMRLVATTRPTPSIDINNSFCLDNTGQELITSSISSVMACIASSKSSIKACKRFILRSYKSFGI